MKRTILLAAGLVVSIAMTTQAYVETWDDAGLANHNWVTDYDTKGIWHPMFHETAGGLSGGHVWTDLDDLLTDVFPGGGSESSPAWVYGPAPEQDVDLTGRTVRVATRLDLAGDLAGSLHFYIGTWSNGGHFFYHSQPIVPGDGAWQETVMPVGGAGDDSQWADLYVVNEDLQADDIFDQPAEYGFIILLQGAAGPTGTLGFDDFQIVPEPTSISLLGLVGLALRRRRA